MSEVKMAEAQGWDLVAEHIVEPEPPPIPAGPWSVDQRGNSDWAEIRAGGFFCIGAAYMQHPKRNLEVARLWAAAPDLVAALELACEEIADLFPGTGAVGAAWAEYVGERSPLPALPLEAEPTP